MRPLKEIEELAETIKLLREDVNKNLLDVKQALSKALTLNYLLIISKHLFEEIDTLINSLECGRSRLKEVNCKEMFKGRVKEYTDEISAFNIEKALGGVDGFLNSADQRLNDTSYTKDCKKCWQQLRPTLFLQKKLIESVNMLEGRDYSKLDISDIGDFDERKIFNEVIEPLSHIARLRVMKSIFEGKHRFSELVEATKLSSGHLIYHLRPLKKQNLIIQDEAKNYILSPKGYWILAALKQTMEETQKWCR